MTKLHALLLALSLAGAGCGSATRPGPATSSASSVQPSSELPGAIARIQPLNQRTKLRLQINPGILAYLPLNLALAKGWLDRAGLDIDLSTYRGGSGEVLSRLAKGDVDMSGTTPSPPLFNQFQQGFDARVITVLGVPKEGRASDTWLTVLKDEAGQIKDYADLKGRTIEAATEGSTPDLLAISAVKLAGLTPGTDVKIDHKARTIQDLVSLAKAKSADVVAMNEPLATQAQKDGTVVKWKTYIDLVPWYQGAQLSVSGAYLKEHREAVVKFLEVYVQACRLVNATNGQWTDDFLTVASTRGDVPPDVIRDQGPVPYYAPDGLPSVESLGKVQDVWIERGLLSQKIDVANLVDLTVSRDAVARIK
jgi:ABC-type nitrate/sulfonate/bicarbonate transport system substrate-binding protein